MTRTPLLALALLLLTTVGTVAQTTPKRIRGAIQSVEGNSLSVVTPAGETLHIGLAPNYTVGAVMPTTLDKVKPGSMIGIVGFGPPAHQRAAVISIFPPGATVNEAQFPWDSQPDSVMTNAPVVSEVASADGRTLTVTVKGERVEVVVPPNAIVQETGAGSPDLLVPGAKVLIFAQQAADGTLIAPRLYAGRDGYTPAN